MEITLKNKIPNNNLKRPMYNTYLSKFNKIKTKNKKNIYLNLKYSDGAKYINKKTELESLFIIAFKCINNKHIYFITLNSVNPNLEKYNELQISEDKFQYLKNNLYPYSNNYNINDNGYIYIILNNTKSAMYNSFFLNKDDINNKLNNLIYNIRKYSQRKIFVKIHPKDTILGLDIKIIDNYTKIIKDKIDIFNNIYCCFIQNTRFIFEFVSKGIPVFNLNFYDNNYFNNIYLDIKDIEKIDINNLPDREEFLRYNYKFIYDEDYINDINKTKILFNDYNIQIN